MASVQSFDLTSVLIDLRRRSSIPELGEWYYEHNLPIVQQRMIAAGVRLARLLNTIFPSAKK